MINTDYNPQGSPDITSSSPSVVRFMDSVNSMMCSDVDKVFRRTTKEPSKESMELQCASLLLSVADIVAKEIDSEGVDWEDDMRSDPPPLTLVETENMYLRSVTHTTSDADADVRPRNSIFNRIRVRTVSIDLGEDINSRGSSPDLGFTSKSGPPMVSPMNSPVSRRTPRRKSGMKALMLNKRSEMPTKKSVQAKGTLNGQPVKTILRKKFSWKNYPEVCTCSMEFFLIGDVNIGTILTWCD